ncbi:MAG: superfamily I DNA/RNA helicase [Marinobacter sp. T13-3]|nr:MAG: superfamily I DNA/RNA helicase [Marinobacter sp. T13-3]
MINAIRYFAFSLIDSQSAPALLSRQKMKGMGAQAVTKDQIKAGHAETKSGGSAWIQTEAQSFAYVDKESVTRAFEGKPKAGDWIKAELLPMVYQRDQQFRHSAKTHQWAPEFINPVSVKVYVHRSGRIVSHGRPRLARECLEPAGQGGVIIGAMDDLDAFYANNPYPEYDHPGVDDGQGRLSLQETLEYAAKMVDTVSGVDLTKPLTGLHYDRLPNTLLVFRTDQDASIRPLLAVYDALETLNIETPVLDRFTLPLLDRMTPDPQPPQTFDTFGKQWGTVQPSVKLSEDQFRAINAALSLQEGEILAINGPPGTGKTAILKDIVASSVVRGVLDDQPPPLMAIASTNNQAIRNAMNSLTKYMTGGDSKLHRRWIPNAPGLAVYAVSQYGEALADANELFTLNKLDALEQEIDVEQAEVQFCRHAIQYLRTQGLSGVEQAVDALRKKLKAEVRVQQWVGSLAGRLRNTQSDKTFRKIQKELATQKQRWLRQPSADHRLAMAWTAVEDALRDAQTRFDEAAQIVKAFHAHKAIIMQGRKKHPLLKRLPWLAKTAFGAKLARQTIAADLAGAGMPSGYTSVEDAKQYYQAQQREHRRTAKVLLRNLADSDIMGHWQFLAEETLASGWRYNWFWLAMHIREGEWLIALRDTLRAGDMDKRTHDKVLRRLHRHAALVPVMVATLHRLPKVLTYWDIGKLAELPLTNVLSHLFIDEGGQCAPDITAASMALTKRATVIGDRAQLEPVWTVTEREDVGNRVASGLMTQQQAHGIRGDQFGYCGGSTSSGSALWLAQEVTTACEDNDQPGLWLRVNRRSVPDILAISNALCYKNALQPGREPATDAPYPAIGTLEFPGVCQQDGGSRSNPFEALGIAQWLSQESGRITQTYQKPLGECVAIITPFKAQADALQEQVNRLIGADAGITIGTIHSLQGAERPIVILSLTYSGEQQPQQMFFDQSPTMLNVAASRAQDTFIVAGDLDVLSRSVGAGKVVAQHAQKLGHALPWHQWTPDMVALGETLWGHKNAVTWLADVQENPLVMALKDDSLTEMVVTINDLDAEGLQNVGQQMINAARQGFTIMLIIARSTALEHPDAARLGRGFDVLQRNGISIRYAPTVLSNRVLLTNGMTMISRTTWITTKPLEQVVVIQESGDLEVRRARAMYGLETGQPEQQKARTAAA